MPKVTSQHYSFGVFTTAIILTLLTAVPSITSAAFTGFTGSNSAFGTGQGTGLGIFVMNVVNFINGILIPAILAIAFLFFVWGIFKYFIAGGANEEARDQGKNLMIYATLGFVFIVIFWGLVNFLAATVGLDGQKVAAPKTITIP